MLILYIHCKRMTNGINNSGTYASVKSVAQSRLYLTVFQWRSILPLLSFVSMKLQKWLIFIYLFAHSEHAAHPDGVYSFGLVFVFVSFCSTYTSFSLICNSLLSLAIQVRQLELEHFVPLCVFFTHVFLTLLSCRVVCIRFMVLCQILLKQIWFDFDKEALKVGLKCLPPVEPTPLQLCVTFSQPAAR